MCHSTLATAWQNPGIMAATFAQVSQVLHKIVYFPQNVFGNTALLRRKYFGKLWLLDACLFPAGEGWSTACPLHHMDTRGYPRRQWCTNQYNWEGTCPHYYLGDNYYNLKVSFCLAIVQRKKIMQPLNLLCTKMLQLSRNL